MPTNKIKLMIVDKSRIYRSGLRSVLEAQGDIEVVAEMAPGQRALQKAQRLKPHVVLLGLSSHPHHALRAIRASSAWPRTRVIYLAGQPSQNLTREVFRRHAFGLLSKDVELRELVDTVRTAAQGRRRIISMRELAVLEQVVDGKSLREIATLLRLREKRVGKVMSSTIRKLDAYNRTHAVVRAMQRGWIPLEHVPVEQTPRQHMSLSQPVG